MIDFERDEFYEEVGRRMKLFREREGYTQEEVAEQLGMPRSSYANSEKGRQRVPLDLLWRLAVVLGKQVQHFVPQQVIPDEGPGDYGWVGPDSNGPDQPEIVLDSEPMDTETARMISDF